MPDTPPLPLSGRVVALTVYLYTQMQCFSDTAVVPYTETELREAAAELVRLLTPTSPQSAP